MSVSNRKKPGKSGARTATKRTVRALSAARVASAVATLSEPKGTARFAAGKALVVTAEKDPARVYPHFDAIAALLASDSKVVRWNAMRIVALLAAVDDSHRVDAHLKQYLAFIRGDNMITAANAVGGAALIARARPDLADRVLRAILGVETATYETAECRNVVIGQALAALEEWGPEALKRPKVAAFVRRQVANPRAKVATLAGKMLAGLDAVE